MVLKYNKILKILKIPELSLDYPGIILVLSLDCHLIIPWLSLDYPWIVPGLSLASLLVYLRLSLLSVKAGESKLLPFETFLSWRARQRKKKLRLGRKWIFSPYFVFLGIFLAFESHLIFFYQF